MPSKRCNAQPLRNFCLAAVLGKSGAARPSPKRRQELVCQWKSMSCNRPPPIKKRWNCRLLLRRRRRLRKKQRKCNAESWWSHSWAESHSRCVLRYDDLLIARIYLITMPVSPTRAEWILVRVYTRLEPIIKKPVCTREKRNRHGRQCELTDTHTMNPLMESKLKAGAMLSACLCGTHSCR